MIGSGLSFEFDWQPPITLLANGFDTMGTSVKSFKEPLTRSVREVINPSIATNFAVGGRPPWTPLSPLTVFKKGHATILIESGRLAKVAPQMKSWSIDGIAGEARLDSVSAPYGVYHQNGFYNVRTGTFVPAREWAVIQEQDAEKVEEIFWEWLEERWNRDVAMGRI